MKLPAGHVPGLGVRKATAKGGLGERLLKSMGWSEGKGLGRQEDGIASAIEVKKKDDAAGVGANVAKAVQWENRWWEDAFNSAAAKLQEDAQSSSSSSDSDDSTATAPLPEVKRQRLHRDGVASSATEQELRLAAALAKDRWGRFGGREGKMARIRAQERLASVAAGASAPVRAVVAAASPAVHSAPAAVQLLPPDNAEAAPVKTKRKAGNKAKHAAQQLVAAAAVVELVVQPAGQKPKPRKRRKADELAVCAAQPSSAAAAAPDSDRSTSDQASAKPWWGTGRFVSSGCLTGLQREDAAPAARPRAEFSEATQEQLYLAVHSAKTAGKKGLGRVSSSGVMGGAKWQGQRVVFEEAPAAAQQDSVVEATAAVSASTGSDTIACRAVVADTTCGPKKPKKAKKKRRKEQKADTKSGEQLKQKRKHME